MKYLLRSSLLIGLVFMSSCENNNSLNIKPVVEQSQYSYDANGRLTSVSYSNGLTIKYSYDAAGNMLSQTIK